MNWLIQSKKQGQKFKMKTVILAVLGMVLLGEAIGVLMYLRQTDQVQADLLQYVLTASPLSFFQILRQGLLYQITIWLMGLSIIGNLVNLFLVFNRGVGAGVILSVLTQTTGFITIILWLVQYLLSLFVTFLNLYFSLRLAYFVVRALLNKKHLLVKKIYKSSVKQFILIIILTTLTSIISAIVAPTIQQQLHQNIQEITLND